MSQHSKTSAEPSGKLKMISLAIVNFLRAFFGQKSEPTFQAAKFLSKLKKQIMNLANSVPSLDLAGGRGRAPGSSAVAVGYPPSLF